MEDTISTSSLVICNVCQKQFSQYTCPCCDTSCCSLPCYKSHSLRCTESFMREDFMGEMKQLHPDDQSKKEMMDILKGFHAADEEDPMDGVETSFSEETIQTGGELNYEDLSAEEKILFQREIATGELSKLIEPWWMKPSARTISLSDEGARFVQPVAKAEVSMLPQDDSELSLESEVPLGPETPLPNGPGVQVEDRLSQLPQDIRVLILSRLTMKEGVIISVVSHEWKNKLWKIFPVLNFEDTGVRIYSNTKDDELCEREEISAFLKRVDDVVQNHSGQIIDEFRVKFSLDKRRQAQFTELVGFTFRKRVKRLELDMSPPVRRHQCKLSLECVMPLDQPHNAWTTLTSLCLNYVSVTAQVIEFILRSCTCLEKLNIQNSLGLFSVMVPGSVSLRLKHLSVSYCDDMRSIDITAPKLISFMYYGHPIELHLRNASSLTEVSVFGPAAYVFNSISRRPSQLEFLRLCIHLAEESCLGFEHVPTLTKLKHLELVFTGQHNRTTLGWLPLIEACPSLQKLTFEVHTWDGCPVDPVKHVGRHLSKFLKTFEIHGFKGCRIDFDLACHVVENAGSLEKLIVYYWSKKYKPQVEERAVQLGKRSVSGARVTIKETS